MTTAQATPSHDRRSFGIKTSQANTTYEDVLAVWQDADTIEAIDHAWLWDHLVPLRGDVTGPALEAWTLLAALAGQTKRLDVGIVVTNNRIRQPAVLAKMAATVDEISGGRLILGLGAGWHKPEFEAFGVPFDHKVDRFEEALQIIVPLLREGKVDFSGTYYSAPDCQLLPRGPRPRGPEILIASAKPRMLRLTARYADSWNTAWLGMPTALPERRAKLEAACAEEGRDPSTLAVTVGVSVSYAEPGKPLDKPPSPDKALFGSPEQVAAGLRAYAEQGVAHVICGLEPTTPESLAWLAEALRIYRKAAS